ncbi:MULTISPECIES: hypothetical protein [unclassified Maridesulfovibrio]|uniref:hypothetical protein n=1 Tax=unclassified Maridesulfovibrio TaxID=2794999 RepID=UPI003B439763
MPQTMQMFSGLASIETRHDLHNPLSTWISRQAGHRLSVNAFLKLFSTLKGDRYRRSCANIA